MPSSPTLCLGGSFNPIHLGHLLCARAAAEAAGFGAVRLIVAGRNPLKADHPGVIDADHRVAMCRLAVADPDPTSPNAVRFEVDDRETRRDGPSYTVDTAASLASEPAFSGRPVDWLIGADLLPGLPRWHEAPRLLEGSLVRFHVMRRGGYAIDWDSLPPPVQRLRDRVIDVPDVEISATEIRNRLWAGRDIRWLVPPAVEEYLVTHRLYREP